MPGIGIISNPRSRQNLKKPERLERLAYILGRDGGSRATRSLDDLREAAEYFKGEGIDILAINGGDGTNHVALTTFIKVYGDTPLPNIALLRGGTMNTTADGLGVMKASPSKILTHVVEKYAAGEPFETVRTHVLKVGDLYGFIYGNGLVQNFLDLYYAEGNPPTPATAAKVLFKGIGSTIVRGETSRKLIKRFEARVVADGEEWAQRDFIALAASTQPGIGLGFSPFTRAYEKPGHFHVVGLFTGPLGFVGQLPRIYAGKGFARNVAISQVVRRLEVYGSQPLQYTIDGDVFTAGTELVVECGPLLSIILR